MFVPFGSKQANPVILAANANYAPSVRAVRVRLWRKEEASLQVLDLF
jgi:hypothetical protein